MSSDSATPTVATKNRSYVNVHLGLLDRLREHLAVYRFRRAAELSDVANLISGLKESTRKIEALLGGKLIDRRILEIGPGQLLKQARFFGATNNVTALDMDYIALEGPRDLWRMWRSNGTVRLTKTLSRKLLGFDRRLVNSLSAAMPGSRSARITFVQGDASATGLPANSFDVTMSYSVLEHVSTPDDVIRELVRVTRSQGVFFHLIHLYTSTSGAHDPRSFGEDFARFPAWCHLRADCVGMSRPNCYVNEWTLGQWTALIERQLPGATIERIPDIPAEKSVSELKALRDRGELTEFSDADLLTTAIIVSWRKP